MQTGEKNVVFAKIESGSSQQNGCIYIFIRVSPTGVLQSDVDAKLKIDEF